MSAKAPLTVLVSLALALSAGAQTLYGPTPYLSPADSPFPVLTPQWVLEDFEDGLLNAPGVSASAGYVTSTHFSGSIIDSVDADDGVINGACAGGDSYFYGSGAVGIIFTFDAAVLGGLPRKAGLAWTDGGSGTSVTFEAFDANGASLGQVLAPNVGDGSNNGTTAEDRFFGVEHAAGIKQLKIRHSAGGLEVDHLQYERPCGVSAASIYCTAKTNSQGCAPQIGYDGCPSASSTSAFRITCSQVLNNTSGRMFSGFGQLAAPFQGGFLCVQPPTRRTTIQSSGGNAGPDDCSGQYSFDMRNWIQSNQDPNLVVGATAYAQYWMRDPSSASTTGLSNGLGFTVMP